jgi:DNA end-binding protein Ku
MIIEKRAGAFDPASFHDRYQDALRALVEAKAKGSRIVSAAAPTPAPVIDLMAALKRSLAAQGQAKPPAPAKRAAKKKADSRQANLLLPVKGGKTAAAAKAKEPAEEAKVVPMPKARTRKRA